MLSFETGEQPKNLEFQVVALSKSYLTFTTGMLDFEIGKQAENLEFQCVMLSIRYATWKDGEDD